MSSKKRLKQTTLFNLNRTTSRPASSNSFRTSPSQLKRKRSRVSEPPDDVTSDSEGVGDIKLEPKSPSKTRSMTRKQKFKHVVDTSSEDGAVAKSSETNSDSDTKHVVSTRKSQSRQTRSKFSDSDSDSSTIRAPVIRIRRRIQEPSDEDDDLDDEVDKDSILPTRFRARGKMTAYQKNLEKLKRRKLGKAAEPTAHSGSSDEKDGDESDNPKPFKGAKPHSDRDSLFSGSSDESDASSNFIVEDDGGMQHTLPVQFSMETHQDLSHQFKKVFQFFVHIAVRAPKERHQFMFNQMRDEVYFSIPLQMIRRKLAGLRDSLVASSIWRPEFRKSLERYPEFELTELDYAVPGCDACHLGGRRSTLIGRLTGVPYDALGFEVIDQESDSEDEGNSERREFSLGRFCAKRTRVYHELSHWEHALFKCVREEVDDLHAAKQSKGFIRVAYSGRKRPPKDLEDADGICEWLDERKIIDMEWQRIKGVMESTRHLEMFSKDDVD